MMSAGVFAGAVIEAGLSSIVGPFRSTTLVAAVSAAAIGAAANAHNDYSDIEIDTINRPDRPLPSGKIQPMSVLFLAAILYSFGVAAGAFVSMNHLLLAAACTGLLVAYNTRLKRTGLPGNLVISLVVAITIYYGGLVAGSGTMALVGSLFAFLLTFAREIVKDVEDLPGDTSAASGSLARTAGVKRAGTVVALIVCVSLLILPLPYVSGFGGLYMVAIIPAGIVLLWILGSGNKPQAASRTSRLLKVSMILGMIGLVLGRVSG